MLLEIKLWEKTVGALLYDITTGKVIFQYDNNFVDNGLQIAPLLMPLIKNKEYIFSLADETYKNLPPVFADSLPDKFGNTILDTWLQQQGKTINQLNPVEKLTYIGKRGLGALEYFPNVDQETNNKSIRVKDIVAIANEVLQQKTIPKSSLKNIFQISSSAGGARAKALIAINSVTNEILPGDIIYNNKQTSYYILKIDNNTPIKDYGKIEFIYYQMAKLAKIDFMPSKLYVENGNSHFLTERFDRLNGEKIHMQTLCAIAKMDFNNPTVNSYEQAFRVIMQLNLNFIDTVQLYRRMIFNVLSRNVDDHTKNISFLMDKKGVWRLAPAYDLVYTLNTSTYWGKRHEMSVNGKRAKITIEDVLKIGKDLGITNRKKIILEIVNAISQWEVLAKLQELPNKTMKAIETNLKYESFE